MTSTPVIQMAGYQKSMEAVRNWGLGVGMSKLFAKPMDGLYEDLVTACHQLYVVKTNQRPYSLDYMLALTDVFGNFNETKPKDFPSDVILNIRGLLVYDEKFASKAMAEYDRAHMRVLDNWSPSESFYTTISERLLSMKNSSELVTGIGNFASETQAKQMAGNNVDVSSAKCSNLFSLLARSGAGPLLSSIMAAKSIDSLSQDIVINTVEDFKRCLTQNQDNKFIRATKKYWIMLWAVLRQDQNRHRVLVATFSLISVVSKSGNISDNWWSRRTTAMVSATGDPNMKLEQPILASTQDLYRSVLCRMPKDDLVGMLYGAYGLIQEAKAAEVLSWIIEQSRGNNLSALSAIADAASKYKMFNHSILSLIASNEIDTISQLLEQVIVDPYYAMVTNPTPVRSYANIAYIACKLVYEDGITTSPTAISMSGYKNTLHTMITTDRQTLDDDVKNIKESQLKLSGDRASLIKLLSKKAGYVVSIDKGTLFKRTTSSPSPVTPDRTAYPGMVMTRTHDMLAGDDNYTEVNLASEYEEHITARDRAFKKLCVQYKAVTSQAVLTVGNQEFQPGQKCQLSAVERNELSLPNTIPEAKTYKSRNLTIVDHIRKPADLYADELVQCGLAFGVTWVPAVVPPPQPPQ